MPIDKQPDLAGLWGQVGAYVQVLAISGVAGSIFRAMFAPKGEIKRRIIQGFAGALSAIFLGGAMAHVINAITDTGIYAYLASGFIMGTGGEVAVKAAQERLYGGIRK